MADYVKKTVPKKIANILSRLISLYENEEWAKNYVYDHQWRCYDDVKRISGLCPNSKILNLGGAPYIFEALAIAEGHDVTSLDLDPSRHAVVVDAFNLNVKNINIEDAMERQGVQLDKYDVICMCEIFEHMRINLVDLMKDLSSRMKGNGYLYLTTPNFFHAREFIYRVLLGRRSGPSLVVEWSKLERLGHMGHVRVYSKRELIEFFEYTGFSVQSASIRNRSSSINWSVKGLIPSAICYILERSFDLFGQELVFVLKTKPSSQ